MNFTHYLITRFSVPFKDYINDKNGGRVRTEEWLNHRFRLFENYCFPSVKAQSNQNFTWLVFFDAGTPVTFKERIENFHEQYQGFTPVFVTSAEDFQKKLQEIIQDNIQDKTTLITSRIDNDDAIHEDYINFIQQQAQPNKEKDFLLNFKWGLQLDLKSGILYQSKDESNPFISRVCRVNNQQTPTVFDFGHHEAGSFLPIKQITTLLGWLVIIHDKNMLNTIGGKPLLHQHKPLISFNIPSINLSSNIAKWGYAMIRFLVKGFIAKTT
jgi:hypothetical protein